MKQNFNYFGIFISFSLALVIFYFATLYMAFATLAYCLMSLGVLNRKNPKIHSKFMASAIGIDFLIVLTLEINRNALKTAFAMALPLIQQAHIAMSSLAFLLYFPIVFLGVKGLKQGLNQQQRKYHMNFGVMAYIFRTLGFILMFSLLELK